MASSSPAPRSDDAHRSAVAHRDDAAVEVNGVSSDDEPSVEWGWHGHYPRVANFAGFAVAAICLIMLIGNHVGHQEDIWLVVIAVAFAGLSIGSIVRARTSWRR